VHDFHQIALRLHDLFDGLVGGRSFVDHQLVFSAFHAFGRSDMLFKRHLLFCRCSRHDLPGAVAAIAKTFFVAQSAADERPGVHAARDDAPFALAGTNRAFTGYQHVFAVVMFTADVVVVTIHRRQPGFKIQIQRRRLRYVKDWPHSSFHNAIGGSYLAASTRYHSIF
jgi:hypothetical protein